MEPVTWIVMDTDYSMVEKAFDEPSEAIDHAVILNRDAGRERYRVVSRQADWSEL